VLVIKVIFFFFFVEKRQKRLEQHRSFYKSINNISSDIVSVQPSLSPLQVLRTSIEQSIPTGSSKETMLMTASARREPTTPASTVERRFTDNLLKLKEVLPDTRVDFLASSLKQMNNDIEATINHILTSTKTVAND
jgi:hypothetical protein